MMDDKVFSGKSNVILFAADENEKAMMPIGNAAEHSVAYDFIDDAAAIVASGCCHFDINDPTLVDNKALAALLFGDSAEEREHRIVIQSELHVLRPNNLKYPNKKRARRIWKKWAKRYGTRGGESLVIPRAKLNIDEQGIHLIAQEVKEE